MQLGTTKDQGLYSKPSAAVHPGALAAGTLLHTYNSSKVHYLKTEFVSQKTQFISVIEFSRLMSFI